MCSHFSCATIVKYSIVEQIIIKIPTIFFIKQEEAKYYVQSPDESVKKLPLMLRMCTSEMNGPVNVFTKTRTTAFQDANACEYAACQLLTYLPVTECS